MRKKDALVMAIVVAAVVGVSLFNCAPPNPPSPPPNLLINGDFSQGQVDIDPPNGDFLPVGWEWYAEEPNAAISAWWDDENEMCSIEVLKPGGAPWDCGLQQGNYSDCTPKNTITIEKGKSYEVSFKAAAEVERRIRVSLWNFDFYNQPPEEADIRPEDYMETFFTITSDGFAEQRLTQYSYKFHIPYETSDKIVFCITFGKLDGGLNEATEIWFDDVALTETADVSPQPQRPIPKDKDIYVAASVYRGVNGQALYYPVLFTANLEDTSFCEFPYFLENKIGDFTIDNRNFTPQVVLKDGIVYTAALVSERLLYWEDYEINEITRPADLANVDRMFLVYSKTNNKLYAIATGDDGDPGYDLVVYYWEITTQGLSVQTKAPVFWAGRINFGCAEVFTKNGLDYLVLGGQDETSIPLVLTWDITSNIFDRIECLPVPGYEAYTQGSVSAVYAEDNGNGLDFYGAGAINTGAPYYASYGVYWKNGEATLVNMDLNNCSRVCDFRKNEGVSYLTVERQGPIQLFINDTQSFDFSDCGVVFISAFRRHTVSGNDRYFLVGTDAAEYYQALFITDLDSTTKIKFLKNVIDLYNFSLFLNDM